MERKTGKGPFNGKTLARALIGAAMAVGAFFQPGCGGGPGSGGSTAATTTRTSKNPTSDLGLELKGVALFPAARRFAASKQTLRAKIYQFDEKGEAVKPMPGASQGDVGPDGRFVIKGAPDDMDEFLLQVEDPSGKPLMQAVIPSFNGAIAKETEFPVTPETDLAARVYREWRFHDGGASADSLSAAGRIPALMAYAGAVAANGEEAVRDLAAVQAAAASRFAALAKGPSAKADDPDVRAVFERLKKEATQRQAAAMTWRYRGDAASLDRYVERELAWRSALEEALKTFRDETDGLPAGSRWRAAEGLTRRFVLDCLSGESKEKECGAVDRSIWNEETLRIGRRWIEIEEAADAMTGRARAMTGISAPRDKRGGKVAATASPLESLGTLLGLDRKGLERLSATAAGWEKEFVRDLHSGSAPPAAARAEYRLRLRGLRDVAFRAWLGLDEGDAKSLERSLDEAEKELANRLRRPNPDWASLAEIAARFEMEKLDPDNALKKKIEGRLAGALPQKEAAILWDAAGTFTRLAFATRIPAAFASPPDEDQDGFGDALERALNTNPKDAASTLEPLAVSERAAPKDLDGDGVPDELEIAYGSLPSREDSLPQWESLCRTEEGRAAACVKPGDGADNDGDGKADEEDCAEGIPSDCGPVGSAALGGAAFSEAIGLVYSKEGPLEGWSIQLTSAPLSPKPAAVSRETSRRDGGFAVRFVPGGAHFARAIKAGAKDQTENAVAWLGGDLPALVWTPEDRGSAVALPAPILVDDALLDLCATGMLAAPGGACVTECSAGMQRDASGRNCVCADGKFYSEASGACVESCGEGARAEGGACRCPYGAAADKGGACVCPEGQTLNAETFSCDCPEGTFRAAGTNACSADCPAGLFADPASGACVCPAGAEFDEKGACGCPVGTTLSKASGRCEAACPEGGVLFVKTGACLDGAAGCPAGTVLDPDAGCVCSTGSLDPTARQCILEPPGGGTKGRWAYFCPEGSMTGPTGACVCPDGSAPGAGGCRPGCPEGFEKGAEGSCAKTAQALALEQAPDPGLIDGRAEELLKEGLEAEARMKAAMEGGSEGNGPEAERKAQPAASGPIPETPRNPGGAPGSGPDEQLFPIPPPCDPNAPDFQQCRENRQKIIEQNQNFGEGKRPGSGRGQGPGSRRQGPRPGQNGGGNPK